MPAPRVLFHSSPIFMADSSSRSGGSTAIVAIVAVLAIALLVYFVFIRGGGSVPGVDSGGGPDINVEVNPPGGGSSN